MIQVRLSHSAHADICACGPLSYPAGPACWQSGCLSSVSGTSPSKQTWSEVGRDHEARPEISEKTTRRDEDRESTCGLFFWLILKLLLTWLNVKNYMQGIFFCFFLRHQFFVFASHLEGLSILALPSSFPEKCLLLLFLLLLLQSPNMLLKTYKGIFFVHICKQITALSVGWTYTNTHSCRSTMTW